MDKSKNRLKGFTLIELIVVIAVFGIIMAATLNMIQPVSSIFRKTERYSAAEGTVDNVRRTLEDNLRYANRLLVTVGPDVSGGENTYMAKKVNELRKEFYIGDPNRDTYVKDVVYVLKVDNPDSFTDISLAQTCGRMSLWVYKDGKHDTAQPEDKEWLISEGIYKDYGISLSAGINNTKFSDTIKKTVATKEYYLLDKDKVSYLPFSSVVSDPGNFTFALNIYDKYIDRSKNTYTLCKTETDSVITLALTNIASGATAYDETIKIKGETSDKEIPRYMTPEIGTGNDIYFFFTRPEF